MVDTSLPPAAPVTPRIPIDGTRSAAAKPAGVPPARHGSTDRVHHLLAAGRLAEARRAAERARELAPENLRVWLQLGDIAAREDEDKEAIGHFRKALELHPGAPAAHYGLAAALWRTNDIVEALAHIDAACRQAPANPAMLSLRAVILMRHFRHAEAMDLLQGLIKTDPLNAAMHVANLGNAQRDVGCLAESEQAYRRAISLRPDDILTRCNLLTLMHYMPDRTAAGIEQGCRELGALFARGRKGRRPVPADRSPDKRLRVGMFSDGLRQHPVGAMTTAALEALAGHEVELYLYATTTTTDRLTRRLMRTSTRWQCVASMTDEQFIRQIKDDEIDILIDLAGHGAGTRMRVMAHEPAPLLVKWVGGLINTTGVESIDYLITDAIESPPGSDSGYVEKLIRMPDDYICYLPPAHVPDVGPLPALANGHVTFGCFNNPTKINPVVLAQWARLLNAVPGSRLLLKSGPYDSPVMQRMVIDAMSAHGVPAGRIAFSGQSAHYQLFAAYNDVDVALDPWPYSGGLTTCEAMLMGVPVVTLPGPTFAGRHSATHLVNAGMPELVAADWDAYRARAIELASNLDDLAAMRRRLRATLLGSPVCDGERFAGHLANALRAIWQRYCEGKPAAALHMGADGSAHFDGDQAPVALAHPALPPEETDFQWTLHGPLIAVDGSGRLLDRPSTETLLSQGLLEAVVFDAGGARRDSPLLARGNVHYQPGLALDGGAGRPRQARTVALGDIEGLPAIDWLLLDSEDASAAILADGEQALAQTLVIDARVVFHAPQAGQPTLAEVDGWATRQGFRLHRLHAAEYGHASGLPDSRTLAPTMLLHADALFVPGTARLARLDTDRRQKLACILHTSYGLTDIAYATLAGDPADAGNAQRYLDDRHIAGATGGNAAIRLRSVGTRNEARTAVELARSLHRWNGYALDVLIRRCASTLERDRRNETAHLLLVHALAAKGALPDAAKAMRETALLRDLSARLHVMAWAHKGLLYRHWLKDARLLRARPRARISAVLAATGPAAKVLAQLQALRRRGGDDVELVLLNDGAPPGSFAAAMPLLDVYIETRVPAGVYLARNLAAVYARAPVLLFLDGQGIPAPDGIEAHLRAHRDQDAIAVHGPGAPRPAPEGNVSFVRAAFAAVGGWGDYLLAEHGGIDIGNRLAGMGYARARMIHSTAAPVRPDAPREEAVADKFARQRAPWLLLDALGTNRSMDAAG